MIYWIERGNIFEIEGIYNYAHGCNCAGAMGKGIAVQFKANFPEMYREYRHLCNQGLFKLGDVFEFIHEKGVIYNLGTQRTWKTPAQIEAIEGALIKMLDLARNNSVSSIAMPKIGAGLGGLDWLDVKSIIQLVSKKYEEIDLYIVENFE